MIGVDLDAIRTAIEREQAGFPLPALEPAFREPHRWPVVASTGEGTTDGQPPADDRPESTRVNMPAGKRWTHVRVPVELAARLDRLARAMERAHAAGRVSLPAEMVDRVPVWFVIANALSEQEARRARSARPRRKPSP